jgi:hypothetical protein
VDSSHRGTSLERVSVAHRIKKEEHFPYFGTDAIIVGKVLLQSLGYVVEIIVGRP